MEQYLDLEIDLVGFPEELKLFLNGEVEDSSIVKGWGKLSHATIGNIEFANVIKSYSYKTIGETLGSFEYNTNLVIENIELLIKNKIHCLKFNYGSRIEYQLELPYIKLSVELLNWDKWFESWSISEFIAQFEKNFNSRNLSKSNLLITPDSEQIKNTSILFELIHFSESDSLVISNEVENFVSKFKNLTLKTIYDMKSSENYNSLISYFKFPEEYKSACIQYLIYFGQFLSDIGIHANIEVKEELEKTLFKVKSEEKEDCLSNIKDALKVYLEGPISKISDYINENSDIALTHWNANIGHFISQLAFKDRQLALANSTIQNKESTIELLKLTNYQLNQSINIKAEEIDTNSLKLLDGIIIIDKAKFKGITINLATIIRILKRKFQK